MPIQQLLQKYQLASCPGKWTPGYDAIVRKVLTDLMKHAGLKLPNQNVSFVFEAYSTSGVYGGVLYQGEIPSEDENLQLVPIGCASTTKMGNLTLEIE